MTARIIFSHGNSFPAGTYQVIARKWRPQTFADLVGQDGTGGKRGADGEHRRRDLVGIQVDLSVTKGTGERLRGADFSSALEFHCPKLGMIRGAHPTLISMRIWLWVNPKG